PPAHGSAALHCGSGLPGREGGPSGRRRVRCTGQPPSCPPPYAGGGTMAGGKLLKRRAAPARCRPVFGDFTSRSFLPRVGGGQEGVRRRPNCSRHVFSRATRPTLPLSPLAGRSPAP